MAFRSCYCAFVLHLLAQSCSCMGGQLSCASVSDHCKEEGKKLVVTCCDQLQDGSFWQKLQHWSLAGLNQAESIACPHRSETRNWPHFCNLSKSLDSQCSCVSTCFDAFLHSLDNHDSPFSQILPQLCRNFNTSRHSSLCQVAKLPPTGQRDEPASAVMPCSAMLSHASSIALGNRHD